MHDRFSHKIPKEIHHFSKNCTLGIICGKAQEKSTDHDSLFGFD